MAKIACIAVLCMVVLAIAPHAQALLTCADVNVKLAVCLPYLTLPLGLLGDCCDGVKQLYDAATTTADRQMACTCLKVDIAAILGFDWVKAAGLPSKCGVPISYLSANIDCATVV